MGLEQSLCMNEMIIYLHDVVVWANVDRLIPGFEQPVIKYLWRKGFPEAYYGLGSLLLTASILGVSWARQHLRCTAIVVLVGAVTVI